MNSLVLLVLAFSCAISVRVDSLMGKLSFDENLLLGLISKNTKLTEKVSNLESDLRSLKGILRSQEKVERDLEHNILNVKLKRQADEHIAFSAYVDHEVLSMGKDQTVQFQNVIINDGNGYNKFTGVFTVPRNGVYQLTFFVRDYHQRMSIFHMVVNRNIVTSAVVEPSPDRINVQGGNTVIIRLNAGDSVWVSSGSAGGNIEGYDLLRTSTFSGYFLYA